MAQPLGPKTKDIGLACLAQSVNVVRHFLIVCYRSLMFTTDLASDDETGWDPFTIALPPVGPNPGSCYPGAL